jgi:hypothetical protein
MLRNYDIPAAVEWVDLRFDLGVRSITTDRGGKFSLEKSPRRSIAAAPGHGWRCQNRDGPALAPCTSMSFAKTISLVAAGMLLAFAGSAMATVLL